MRCGNVRWTSTSVGFGLGDRTDVDVHPTSSDRLRSRPLVAGQLGTFVIRHKAPRARLVRRHARPNPQQRLPVAEFDASR